MEEQSPSEKQELIEEVVGFNFRKLWFTFKELTLRPGETVAAYCDGSRKKFISAITYFLLTFGVYYFSSKATRIMDKSLELGYSWGAGNNETGDFVNNAMAPLSKSPKFTPAELENIRQALTTTIDFLGSKEGMLLLSVPIALLFQWLFFRKFRKPFLNHLYLYLFITAQTYLLTTVFLMPVLLFPALMGTAITLSSIISFGYFFYAEIKFYAGITAEQLVLRTIGQFVASIIPFFIWVFAIFVSTFFIVLRINS